MKKYSFLLAILMLALASLACQTLLSGDGADSPPISEDPGPLPEPGEPPSGGDDSPSTGGDSQFVMPGDATDVITMGEDTTIFTTAMSIDEVMAFYRDELGNQGLTERELLTVTSEGTFSFVFDGHESGKAVVVQGVDMGNGTTTVTITLQDI
jgi:hypothetical protein